MIAAGLKSLEWELQTGVFSLQVLAVLQFYPGSHTHSTSAPRGMVLAWLVAFLQLWFPLGVAEASRNSAAS